MSQYHLGILIVKGNLMPVGSGPTRERLPKGLLQLASTPHQKQSDLPKKGLGGWRWWISYDGCSYFKKGFGGKTLSRNKKGAHGFNGWLLWPALIKFPTTFQQLLHGQHQFFAIHLVMTEAKSFLSARWSSITCTSVWKRMSWNTNKSTEWSLRQVLDSLDSLHTTQLATLTQLECDKCPQLDLKPSTELVWFVGNIGSTVLNGCIRPPK